MVNAALPLETLRACSKDAAAFQQLVDLFERYTSEGANYYRLLADHFPDGIVALVDHDLRFILVNGQGLQSSGLDPDSMQGRRLGEVFSEDVAARDEPHIRAALQGEARSTEVSYQGHHYLVRTLPVRDTEHRIIAAMVVTQDITERKQVEDDLRQAQQRLEGALEAARMGVWDIDLTTMTARTSLRHNQIFGYTDPVQVWGSELFKEHIHSEDQDAFRAAFTQAMESGNFDLTVRVRWPNGEVHWVHAWGRVYYDENGTPVRMAGVTRDVTDAKAAELALRESESQQRKLVTTIAEERTRLAAILQNLPVSVWIADHTGWLIGKNEQADRIWAGAAPLLQHIEEYPEYTAWYVDSGQLLRPEDYPVAKALQTGEVVEPVELQIRRFDGTEGTILVSAAPILDTGGQVTGAVGINVDITERKILEQQRAELLHREHEARREAEKALATQRLFLGMISHELRTPLASIKGFASTIMATDVTFELEQMREFSHIINDEADRLTELIEHLLDVARVQSGTLRVNPTVISLDKVIDGVMPQLRSVAAQHPLVMNLHTDLPLVLADRQRTGQILVNLVGNAAKFSPQHMPITLSARVVNDFVRVDITDAGEGIPPSQRTSVFDAFYRVAVEGRPTPGTGLGLAICKGLVEAHGGSIWIEDRPDPGTTIAFTLPRAKRVNGQFAMDRSAQ